MSRFASSGKPVSYTHLMRYIRLPAVLPHFRAACAVGLGPVSYTHLVGGLDPACDGSQDHDLFLKLSEKTVPVHIPKVLYYWRVHAASTSAGTGAKPYVCLLYTSRCV